MTYTVLLIPAEEGGYTVRVPALPGCITEGDTLLEALDMSRDAIECYLGSLAQHGEPIPEEGSTIPVEVEGFTEALLFRVAADVPSDAETSVV